MPRSRRQATESRMVPKRLIYLSEVNSRLRTGYCAQQGTAPCFATEFRKKNDRFFTSYRDYKAFPASKLIWLLAPLCMECEYLVKAIFSYCVSMMFFPRNASSRNQPYIILYQSFRKQGFSQVIYQETIFCLVDNIIPQCLMKVTLPQLCSVIVSVGTRKASHLKWIRKRKEQAKSRMTLRLFFVENGLHLYRVQASI